MSRPSINIIDRFKTRYKILRNNCWVWLGWKNKKGYGRINILGKHYMAHRASYLLFKGKIPEGMFVCHKCDNPSCVNPEHLFLGTNSDNMQDMLRKGREYYPNGEDHYNHKLTKEDIFNIRLDQRSQESIAKDYDVHRVTIGKIKRQLIWKHI